MGDKNSLSGRTETGAPEARGGMFERSIEFLKESKNELGRVIFPTRHEVVGSTVVVILSVIFVSIFLGAVDLVLSRLMTYIVG